VVARLVSPQGQQTPITDQMVVGRDPACTLFVDVDDVSRRHATIVAQGAGWAVLDLGSRNGTFVNDQQVLTATSIYHLDRLRFGLQSEFVLYDPAHPRPPGAVGSLPQTRVIATPGSTQTALVSGSAVSTPSGPTRYQWPKAPQVEGYVLSMRGPMMIEKGGKAGKAMLSIGLGLINPALVFLPWAMGKSQIAITVMRVQNADDGSSVAVTLVGDQRSIIEDGDFVAVWGKVDQGTIYAVDLFNYGTGAMVRFKT